MNWRCIAVKHRLLLFHSPPACDTVRVVDMNLSKQRFAPVPGSRRALGFDWKGRQSGRELPGRRCPRFEPISGRGKTSNIQHPASNIHWPRLAESLDVGRWMLDVGCLLGSWKGASDRIGCEVFGVSRNPWQSGVEADWSRNTGFDAKPSDTLGRGSNRLEEVVSAVDAMSSHVFRIGNVNGC